MTKKNGWKKKTTNKNGRWVDKNGRRIKSNGEKVVQNNNWTNLAMLGAGIAVSAFLGTSPVVWTSSF